MKKTIVALAVLSATSAFAQVSLTGVVRAAYQKTNSTSFTTNQTGFALTDATISVGAVEDIGSMKASAGITLDQNSDGFPAAGTGTTANSNGSSPSTGSINRRNTFIQLAGGFGVVRFDQTRSGDLLTRAWVAPTNLSQGIYDGSTVLTRSAVDAISYSMPFGAVTAGLQFVETSDGSIEPAVSVTVFNIGYKDGALEAGVALKSSTAKLESTSATWARSINSEAFVTYDFGMAKVGLGYDSANAAVASSALNDAAAFSFGIAVPVTGQLTVGANYASRDVANTSEYAANYALSKRTVFNASYGRQTAKETTTRTADQFRMSLAHNF